LPSKLARYKALTDWIEEHWDLVQQSYFTISVGDPMDEVPDENIHVNITFIPNTIELTRSLLQEITIDDVTGRVVYGTFSEGVRVGIHLAQPEREPTPPPPVTHKPYLDLLPSSWPDKDEDGDLF